MTITQCRRGEPMIPSKRRADILMCAHCDTICERKPSACVNCKRTGTMKP